MESEETHDEAVEEVVYPGGSSRGLLDLITACRRSSRRRRKTAGPCAQAWVELDRRLRRFAEPWYLSTGIESRREFLASRELFRDVYQDFVVVLLARRVLERCNSKTDEQARSYLRVVFERVVRDHVRRRRALKRRVRFVSIRLADDLEPEGTERDLQEREIYRRELRVWLRRSCRDAWPGQFMRRNTEVFELAAFDGWTCREVRMVFPELSLIGVGVIVSRMRKRLREHVRDQAADVLGFPVKAPDLLPPQGELHDERESAVG